MGEEEIDGLLKALARPRHLSPTSLNSNDGKISRAQWNDAWARSHHSSLGSVLHGRSLKERFLGSSFTKLTNLAEHLQDCNTPSYEDNDLRVVAEMVMARHITVDRMNHEVNLDAPLTISDVPMLVSLMQAAPLRANLCCLDSPFAL